MEPIPPAGTRNDPAPPLFSVVVVRYEMAEQINQIRLQLEFLLLRRLRPGLSSNLSLTMELTLAQGFRLRVVGEAIRLFAL